MKSSILHNDSDILFKTVLIRQACIKDIKKIAYVHWESWKTTYQKIINPEYLKNRTLEYFIEMRQNILNDPNTICVVAVLENEIIGFIDSGFFKFHENQIFHNRQKETIDVKGEVTSLYLLKFYQYKGIGALLFQEMRQKMLEKSLIPYLIWALKDNLPARFFYKKQGGLEKDEISVRIGQDIYKEVSYYFEN